MGMNDHHAENTEDAHLIDTVYPLIHRFKPEFASLLLIHMYSLLSQKENMSPV